MGQVHLYDQPAYYDLALRNDFADEGALLHDCFRKHGPSPVEDILDVGCGTGRLIFDLVERGYRMVGYDRGPRMVEFARKGVEQRGIGERARVFVGDMRACPLPKKRFDAAINACEGLGYLRSDAEIVAHLRMTAEVLRPGGVYIVGITCAWEYPHAKDWEIAWTEEEGDLSVRTEWEIESQDYDRRLSHQVCRMEVNDRGKRIRFEDKHTLRLWYLDELKELVDDSGRFELVAVYDKEGRRVTPDGEVCGEDGYMSCVLKASS